MSARIVVIEITLLEASHLVGMTEQFIELVEEATAHTDDPAVARLLPDAYADDVEAAAEFRRLTGSDLLTRRRTDAERVRSSLSVHGPVPEAAALDQARMTQPMIITLDEEELEAWLRTLTALRLVLASRLGIESEDDQNESDPRFGVYEWLGFRLDGLIDAADG